MTSGKVKAIALLSQSNQIPNIRMSVAPNGEWVCYTQAERLESDVMLVEL